MPGSMKPGPWQELLDEATELGMDTMGYDPANADFLRAAIARRTEELATAEVAKQRIASQVASGGDDEDEEFSGFDEAAGKTRGVLIRLVEFTDWIPVKLVGERQMQGLTIANGITGFEAGEHEKVVSIDSLDTNKRKKIPFGDDPNQFIEYSLHVIKIVLANNVSTDLLDKMIALQGGRETGIEPDPRIVMPDAPKPNRAQRRKLQ